MNPLATFKPICLQFATARTIWVLELRGVIEGVLCLVESFLTSWRMLLYQKYFSQNGRSQEFQPQELELISTWTVQTDLFSKYWHVIFFGAPHPTSTYGTPTLLFKSWGPDPSTLVDPVTRSSLDFMLNTTWAPVTYERSCNPYKWPHKWVTRVITPIFGVILGASPS